jgi:A/G-specific adenine glycosylase
MLSGMWTRGLAPWYREHGRHDLPWRHTKDPWAVLVSEVMLQQTHTARVRRRWQPFLDRWPTPRACASAELSDVLRFWQGLGYPRRARALWQAAAAIHAGGWPDTEKGLRDLPGVGEYTARALLTLAFDQDGRPPLDINIARVTARAALGVHPQERPRAELEAAVIEGRPRGLDARHYTFALFDAGAVNCRAVPTCGGCPLARQCTWVRRGRPADARLLRRQRYEGTMRQLRGAVLKVQLSERPAATLTELQHRVARYALASEPGALERAVAGLHADGLLAADAPAIPTAAR